jgi:hypothetical protein
VDVSNMNFYSAELRTPPLPLIAFIQHSELHKDVGAYFSQTLRPPLVSVGVVEANEQLLARLFSPRKPLTPPSTPPEGILKADWFLKQRQRRPAVAVALVSRDELEGDPSSWARVLAQLRVIKDAAAQRGAGVLVLVVHEGPVVAELPADRVAGICHNVALDPSAFCSISKEWLGSADGRCEARRSLAAPLPLPPPPPPLPRTPPTTPPTYTRTCTHKGCCAAAPEPGAAPSMAAAPQTSRRRPLRPPQAAQRRRAEAAGPAYAGAGLELLRARGGAHHPQAGAPGATSCPRGEGAGRPAARRQPTAR